MPKKKQELKINYAEDDINYFNGFSVAVKLFNRSTQFLSKALDEVPDDKLRDTIKSWRDNTYKDLNAFASSMYADLKTMYGMSLRVDQNGGYYIHIEDGDKN